MSAENSGNLSNTIVFSNLLHLSRVVVFSAVPIILHLRYLKYRRYFDTLPPYQTMPLPVPIYPYFIVFPAIILIIFELETLRGFWTNATSSYEALTISLFVFECALLYFTPVLYLRADHYPGILPTLELMVLFLSVFVLGLLEIVLLTTRSNHALSTISSLVKPSRKQHCVNPYSIRTRSGEEGHEASGFQRES